MRALLVSYAELGINSTNHVLSFARGLAAMSWDVSVAVLRAPQFTDGFVFLAVDREGTLTAIDDAALTPAEIVHVWTPRGAIWHFLDWHAALIAGRLILHLEDDEGEILGVFSHGRISGDQSADADQLGKRGLGHLSHPLLARCLSVCSDGVTTLSPELVKGIAQKTLYTCITPPLGQAWYTLSDSPRKVFAESVVFYSGGIHAAVAEDFYQLAAAVGTLSREGRKIKLVRCGPPALDQRILRRGAVLAEHFSDVGFLSEGELIEALHDAAVLVQPGSPSRFNRRRFPAKLPSYLASGTPVVMPACYEWLGVEEGVHAMMFDSGSPEDLAVAIRRALDLPDRGSEMRRRAVEFARQKFDLGRCAAELHAFYLKVLEQGRVGPRWAKLQNPRTELPRWLAASATTPELVSRETLLRFARSQELLDERSNRKEPIPHDSAKPLVSVIIPNYNHRRFLPSRLESVFRQTYREMEVIFLDDASSDASVEYVRSVVAPFPLRILANELNSGSVFKQWERGLMAAQGEYIWIAESDDCCDARLIEKLMAVLQADERLGISFAQSSIIDEQGRVVSSFLDYTDPIDRTRWRQNYLSSGSEEASEYLIIRNTIPNASACLFRRSALLAADLPSIALKVCGDWLVYARICEHYGVGFLAEHLNQFRRHMQTARNAAARDGTLIVEMYTVQNYIARRFEVRMANLELARRTTFQELMGLLRRAEVGPSWVDDVQLLTLGAAFDPTLRDRLAGVPSHGPVTLGVQSSENSARNCGCVLHPWSWTNIAVEIVQPGVAIIPADRPSLIAIRNIRLRDRQAITLWSAKDAAGFQQLEISGGAHRIKSSDQLEILVFGEKPTLRLPATAFGNTSKGTVLEFEARLAGLEQFELGRFAIENKAKRAIFILPHLELGGADRFNLELIAELKAQFGWFITVVTTRRAEDRWSASFEAVADEVFPMHRFLDLADRPQFIRYLLESRAPQVVFLSHSQLGYDLLPWLKSQYPSLPIIDLVHIVMENWKAGGFPRMSAKNGKWLEHTLATSRAMKEWLVKNGHRPDKVSVCYTNVDTARWKRSAEAGANARQQWGLSARRVVILYAARFCDQKNPRILPRVVEGLLELRDDFILVLTGEGADQAWLQEHLCDVFPFHTRMLGALSEDRMRDLFSASDILLLPSREEGIALTLFEALAMEVVPVATDVGGQNELVTPECGFLLPIGPGLEKRVIVCLDDLIGNPEKRRSMGSCGRERVKRDFELSQMAVSVNAVFEAAIWAANPSSPECRLNSLECDQLEARVVAELRAEEDSSQLWTDVGRKGRSFPSWATRLAAWARATPVLGRIARSLESRYGDRIGKAIMASVR